MESAFRLIGEVLVYLYKDQVFISSPDDKTCISKVKKKITESGLNFSICNELAITSENFRLKLGDGFGIYISNNELPGGISKYYKIMNLDSNQDYLSELFNFTEFSKGIWENNFELSINDHEGCVRFLCSEMPSFLKASDEMIRRMNCTIYKKTKKFLPGHRYDTENHTIYYIGKMYSPDIILSSSAVDYEDGESTNEVHIYTTDKKSATKLSEILIYGTVSQGIEFFGDEEYYNIYYSSTLKPMVDGGEVLENDISKYEDYLDIILNNSIKYSKTLDIKLRKFFNSFRIMTNTKELYEEKIIKIVENFVKDSIVSCLYRFWDIPHRLAINPNDTREGIIDKVYSSFLMTFYDANFRKGEYYGKLLSSGLGINMIKIISEVLDVWDPSVLKSDFNIYYNNYKHRGVDYSVQLRTEKSCKYTLTNHSVKDFIVNEDLRESIYELVKYIRVNVGYGAKSYEIINAGTVSKPLIYELITIDVDNIINYYKEKGLEVPENLKYSIIEDKLRQISISVDFGGEII